MSDSTKISNYAIGHFFNVATITSVASATATYGIKISQAFVDKDGAVITGNFFMNVLDTSNNKVERIYVPANGVSADGLTIGVQTTGEVERGLKPTGIDPLDGSATYSFKLKPGMIVAASVDPIILTEFQKAFLGLIATGGLDFVIGDGTASTVTIKHKGIGTAVGWLRRNVSTSKVQFSNDGTSWVNMDNAGVGALTAGRYINAAALALGTVQVDNNYALTTGSANAYVATIPSTTAIYTTGEAIRIKANFSNTGAATIAVNGGAAKSIVRKDGSTALSANDILSGEIYELIFDGTNYRLTQFISDAQYPNLSEANTFFGATDMTGAEAEILTGGGDTTLHSHATQKNGAVTKTVAVTSDTLTIAHGLGVAPRWVKMQALCSNTYFDVFSDGDWNSTPTHSCVYKTSKDNGGNTETQDYASYSTSKIIYLSRFTGGAQITVTATITVYATNITVSFANSSGAVTMPIVINWSAGTI